MKIGGYSNGGGRQPDYRIKVGLKRERYHKQVGAAWKNESGGISIKLDPGLALVSGTDVLITMWPAEEQRPHTSDQQHPWGD